MHESQSDVHNHADERNNHVAAVQGGRFGQPEQHAESLDAGFLVRHHVVGVVSVKHRNCNHTDRQGEDQGLGLVTACKGIGCPKDGQNSENQEDVEVSEGTVFQE